MEWFENDDFWRDFYPFMFADERFAATPDEVGRILALTQCSGGSVLDLCCGTGDMALALRNQGSDARITGADFSHAMLTRACAKTPAGARVTWIEADALHLPFDNNSFDLVTSAFGFRNLADYDAGLR